MMIQFGKFLIICVGALACVSCAIPPTRPPKPDTTIDKPDMPQASAESVPTPPFPTRPTVSPPVPAKPPTSPAVSTPAKPPMPPAVNIPTTGMAVARLPASLVALRDIPAVPGGIAWLSLRSESDTPPNITYQQQRVV